MDFMCENAFLEFIYQKTGILLQQHQLPAFRRQITMACKKFSYTHAEDYLAALKAQQNSERETNFLISSITVGETCFFRYPEQISFFTESWLPKLREQKIKGLNKSLYIWSAGCSSGEEIYSLAILLDQHLPDKEQWTIKLLGTDINKIALEKARKGVYEERSLRNVSEAMKKDYFDKVGSEYKLKSFILRRVDFAYFNLSSNEQPLFSLFKSMDLIICNNVFIYFNQAVIEKIMLNFSNLLTKNGCLLLAPADIPLAYNNLVSNLSLRRWKMLSYFQFIENLKTRLLIKPEIKKPIELPKTFKLRESTKNKEKVLEKSAAEFKREIKILITKADWLTVLDTADKALSIYKQQNDFWQYKAQALTHLGKTVEALQASTEAIKQETKEAYPYWLHAMLQLDNNNITLALKFFRQSLFLKWNFPECHFHLALLLARLKEKKKALKHFENALTIAKTYDAEKSLEYEPEMTYAEFIDILEYEILIIKKALSL